MRCTLLALSLVASASAFAPNWVATQQPRLRGCSSTTALAGRRPNLLSMQVEPAGAAQKPAAPQLLASAALALVLVPSVASAAAPEWLEPVRSSLDIGLAVFSLFFFLRIPLTWYPNMDLNKAPQCIVAWSAPLPPQPIHSFPCITSQHYGLLHSLPCLGIPAPRQNPES